MMVLAMATGVIKAGNRTVGRQLTDAARSGNHHVIARVSARVNPHMLTTTVHAFPTSLRPLRVVSRLGRAQTIRQKSSRPLDQETVRDGDGHGRQYAHKPDSTPTRAFS